MKKPDFSEWLKKQEPFSVPVCNWGPTQTEIAERFAADFAKECAEENKSLKWLNEALNSGDGTYRP